MARYSQTLAAIAGAAVAKAALCGLFASSAAAYEPDPKRLDCAANAVSIVDFTGVADPSGSETFIGPTEDGEITVVNSAPNAFGEEASVTFTFGEHEFVVRANHPGNPDDDNDDFWSQELILIKEGRLEPPWMAFKQALENEPLNFAQRRWTMDAAKNAADELIVCMNGAEEKRRPEPALIKAGEPLNSMSFELERQ